MGTVKIWDVAAGKVLRTLAGHTDGVRGVAFSPDGRTLATGSEDRSVRLWNPATGHELAVLREKQHVTGLAFAPDGKELAVMLHNGTLRLLRSGN
jgi:WD40 repeat protein